MWRLTRAVSHTHHPQWQSFPPILLRKVQPGCVACGEQGQVLEKHKHQSATVWTPWNQIHPNARNSSVIPANKYESWLTDDKSSSQVWRSHIIEIRCFVSPPPLQSVPEALCEVTEGTNLSPPFQTWKVPQSKWVLVGFFFKQIKKVRL